jgi:hypothetical protein
MSPPTPPPAPQPVPKFCPAALGGLALGIAGFGAVVLGAYVVPNILSAATPPDGPRPHGLTVTWQLLTYWVPLVMGTAAAVQGARAMGQIDQSGGRLVGDDPAVFAILTGLLTVVTSAILIFAYVFWPKFVVWWPSLNNVV